MAAYDAEVLIATRALADDYEAVVLALGESKVAANWVMGEVLARLKEAGIAIDQFRVTPAQLAALLGMVRDVTVSNSATGEPAPGQRARSSALRDGSGNVASRADRTPLPC